MNAKVIFAFTLGAAVGTAATWKFFKTKYEKIAQEEIDSVKEVYSKKRPKIEEEEDINIITESEDTDDADDADGWVNEYDHQYAEYRKIVAESGYNNEEKGGSEPMTNEIEVIPPDEFGDILEYDTETLVYYSDGVLADTSNNVIEDVDDMVGPEALDSFGEWEDDVVYIRNDKYKTYYEVTRDYDKYADLNPTVEE